MKLYRASAVRKNLVIAEDIFNCKPDRAKKEITRRAKNVVQSFGDELFDRVEICAYPAVKK